jgi:AraC-like DNA-binding protein
LKSSEPYPKFYLYHRIVKAKLFIDENFHQEIDLHNISSEAYFSKFHFIRLFKSIYGKTPHQYLIYTRVENAKQYLEQGDIISEVCNKVGFDSASSFTGLFKKYCNVTPSEYRRLHAARQEAIKDKPLEFIPACFAEQKGWLKKSNFKEVV